MRRDIPAASTIAANALPEGSVKELSFLSFPILFRYLCDGKAKTMNSQLAGILQISIPVADVVRATAFYRDVLELNFLFAAPNMAFFDCGGVRLYLSGEGSGHQATGAFVYFGRPDIDNQLNVLKERKATIHQ